MCSNILPPSFYLYFSPKLTQNREGSQKRGIKDWMCPKDCIEDRGNKAKMSSVCNRRVKKQALKWEEMQTVEVLYNTKTTSFFIWTRMVLKILKRCLKMAELSIRKNSRFQLTKQR